MKSLKYVLEEVYNLNRFPSSHPMMKDALEFDGTMKMVREEVYSPDLVHHLLYMD